MSLAYLASPYTHADAEVRQARADSASRYAAQIMRFSPRCVYSPIAHGHQVGTYLPDALNESHEFWMRQCFEVMDRCDEIIVLMLDGWKESKGVQMEIARARLTCKPILYQVPSNGFLDLREVAAE